MIPTESADKGDLPGQPESDEDLVKRLSEWERRARRHSSIWRENAREDYDLVAGDQWTAEDKAKLAEDFRVPLVFNRTAPMVDAVCGAEILNRQQVQFFPREIGDARKSELMTAAADWVRDEGDVEDEESDAFADVVICGMGWTETRISYDSNPEGTIAVERLDPIEMYWDPQACKPNLSDARFVVRIRYWELDDVKGEFGEEAAEAIGEGGEAPMHESTSRHEEPEDTADYDNGFETAKDRRDKVLVKHFQWREKVPVYRVEMGGQFASLSRDEYKMLVRQFLAYGQQPPEAVKISGYQYREAIISGTTILSQRELTCGQFTLRCITGKRDRNHNTWYGIVRALRDPQRWANKWLSQILHVLNTNSKGGIMYEAGAFEKPRQALENWADPAAAIEVSKGALSQGKIMPRPAGSFPVGLEKLLEFSVQTMPQVTGINLELLGLVQKEQAGVLEHQRKQAGYAILAVFFNSLRRYRKQQGRILLHYIQRYISDGRLIRVVGEEGAQYVPLLRDETARQYDVVVDEAPMSANQKEQTWHVMAQLLPMLSKAPLPAEVWAEFARYSPLPQAVSEKIAAALMQPNPGAEQQSQMAMMDAQTQIEERQSKTALNMARAQLVQMPRLLQ